MTKIRNIELLATKSAATIGRVLAAEMASPVALAEVFLDKIDAQTSPVFLATTRKRALREARAAETRLRAGAALSPLDGVPIAWKDLIDMAGEPTTAASAIYRDASAAEKDAEIVTNASTSGMVSLGKVNLSEFAYSGLGLNPHFGTPLNPNNPDTAHSPGGSSSGSGVAVAAGLAPIAIGTDTGGSVRIPAAYNGVVGYKSSEGRISTNGVFALSSTLDTIGPLARSVEDCILTDMALRGAVTSPVKRQAADSLTVFVPETVVLDDLEPEVAQHFEASLARLEKAGAKIRRGAFAAFAECARLAVELGTITAAESYVEHRDLIDGPDVARIDRRVVARIEGGKRMSAADLIGLHKARKQLMDIVAAELDGAFLAMPTTPLTAPEVAPLEADDDLFHRVNLKTLRNTVIGNFLNLPGLAIPNGHAENGLPTSFLLAAMGGEDTRLLGAGLSAEPLIRGADI